VPPKFLEYLVILCFQRRYPKQNTVTCLKSNNLAPSNFWAGYATATQPCSQLMISSVHRGTFSSTDAAKIISRHTRVSFYFQFAITWQIQIAHVRLRNNLPGTKSCITALRKDFSKRVHLQTCSGVRNIEYPNSIISNWIFLVCTLQRRLVISRAFWKTLLRTKPEHEAEAYIFNQKWRTSSNQCYNLSQEFPTFLWPCTPVAFQQMSMYP